MLKDHYRIEDIGAVVMQIETILNASQRALQMAETAQFERNQEVAAEILQALENLMMLNRKKVDSEITAVANEYVRRHYF